MAQLVKCPTLDLGSGPNLTVCEFDPCVRLCADSVERAWDSLSPSHSALLALSLWLTLSLKVNKHLKKKSILGGLGGSVS